MTGILLRLMHARSSPVGVLASVAVVCWALAGCRALPRLPRPGRTAFAACVWLALLGAAALAAVDAGANLRWYRPWDFPSFYAVARAAVHGRAFYDPAVLAAVQGELTRTQHVPAQWLQEVGYWYLPPSVFLIWPLGWFGYRTALLLHYLAQGAFLVAGMALVHRARPLAPGPTGFAAALLAALLFLPVQSTIYFAQIVFGCLFCMVLAERWLARAPVAAGASLAGGFFFKHLLLIPAALLVAGRERRGRTAGLAALAAIALAVAASALVLHPAVLRAYLANGPGARSPALAVDPVVQSLMALLYRALGVMPHGTLRQIVAFPPYLAATAALTLASLALAWRSPAGAGRERFWLLASLAILCYPNTLISTLALLVPVVLGVYVTALERGWPFAPALGFVAAVYALAGLAPVQAGWTALLCWLAAAALLATAPRAAGVAAPAR